MFLASELFNVTAAFEIPYTAQRQPHSSVDLLITATEFVEAYENICKLSAHLVAAHMVRQ